MILSMLASVSLLIAPASEPPELTRTDLCWEMYDNCQREAWEDYAADAITGDELLARWDACMDWLYECIDRAQLLDALDNQVPIIPGVIAFPPPWGSVAVCTGAPALHRLQWLCSSTARASARRR